MSGDFFSHCERAPYHIQEAATGIVLVVVASLLFCFSAMAANEAADKANRAKCEKEFEKSPSQLHDRRGNVLGWVEDEFHKGYEGAPKNGSALVDNPRGSDRVVRGGSLDDGAARCRSAALEYYPPEYRTCGVGFRFAISPLRETADSGNRCQLPHCAGMTH